MPRYKCSVLLCRQTAYHALASLATGKLFRNRCGPPICCSIAWWTMRWCWRRKTQYHPHHGRRPWSWKSQLLWRNELFNPKIRWNGCWRHAIWKLLFTIFSFGIYVFLKFVPNALNTQYIILSRCAPFGWNNSEWSSMKYIGYFLNIWDIKCYRL